ncbi:hypothetical protein TNCV_3195861 [Trichonephila clavipes]|nr:hypothetical protein TNCV_3195861 [Trichonephila clavipes]
MLFVVSSPLGTEKLTPSPFDLSVKECHKPDLAHQASLPGYAPAVQKMSRRRNEFQNGSRQKNWGQGDRNPPYQPISGLVPRHIHMRRYPLKTHLFILTKPNYFLNNIQISTVHNLWPIPQILDESLAVGQDPGTVLIRVESVIENTMSSDLKTEQVSALMMLILTSLLGVY